MNPVLANAIAAVIVSAITGLVTFLVARTNLRAAAKNTSLDVSAQIETARIQAVDDAYEKAEAQLGRTIDRQSKEITELESDIAHLKDENASLRRQLEQMRTGLSQCRTVCRRLAQRLGEPTPDFED